MAMTSVDSSIELFARALRGFPDDGDCTFGSFDADYALLEIALCFQPHEGEETATRFLRIERSVNDLLHLEARLRSERDGTKNGETHSVESIVDQFVASVAAGRHAFISWKRRVDRLMWQLETWLRQACISAADSLALKIFIHADARFIGGEEGAIDRRDALVGRCLAAAAVPVIEEKLVSGCSFRHDVVIPVDRIAVDDEIAENSLPTLVVWKATFNGDLLEGSAKFTPRRSHQLADSAVTELDPYSAAAFAETPPDQSPNNCDTLPEEIVQYRTQYAASGHGQTVCGAFLAPVPGVLSFEWTNADTATIFSSGLGVRAHVFGIGSGVGDAEDLLRLYADAGDSKTPWLERLVLTYGSTSWLGEDRELETRISIDEVEPSLSEDLADIKHRHELRAQELEMKVFNLEEELRRTQQDLKSARSELEISSEIYKASLEMIAQLEVSSAIVSKRASGEVHDERTSGNSVDGVDIEEEEDDDEGGEYDEDDADPTATETDRLRSLVATFQEQCLWRSIETTESEKRNMILESELSRLDEQNRLLQDQLGAQDDELKALRALSHKLRAQKSVLVQEVKRLQPYSQANLSALIQEAEEARMMQRSLQGQLNALVRERQVIQHVDPETEVHPRDAPETDA